MATRSRPRPPVPHHQHLDVDGGCWVKHKLPGQLPLNSGTVLIEFSEMEELGLCRHTSRRSREDGEAAVHSPQNPSVSASRQEGSCAWPRDLGELPARLLGCSGHHKMWAVGRKAGDTACPTLGAGDGRRWDPGDCAQPRHKPRAAAAANIPDSRTAGKGFAGVRGGVKASGAWQRTVTAAKGPEEEVCLWPGFPHTNTSWRDTRGTGVPRGEQRGAGPSEPGPRRATHAGGYGDSRGGWDCPCSAPAPTTACCSPPCFSQSWT